jgi:hypothetical protein
MTGDQRLNPSLKKFQNFKNSNDLDGLKHGKNGFLEKKILDS